MTEQPTITQADRDAAAAYWKASMIGSSMTQKLYKSGEFDSSLIVQAFARHRTTSLAAQDLVNCETCCGNGEVVTDWDRYIHPHDGDVGDEAVADCPDCDGNGKIEVPSLAAQDGLVEALRDALAAAYVAGATDVHNAWVEGVNGGEPDFGEAGWDYAHSIALSAIKEQHHD